MVCEAVLRVEDLRVYYFTSRGVARAVDGVSFEIHKGEFFGLVGESGCGKTAIALSILGLVPFPGKTVGGRVLFEETDLLRVRRETLRRIRGKRIAMISQDPMSSLNPVFTVGDQIVTAIRTHSPGTNKKQAWEKAVDMLKLVNITAPERRVRDYPHELSGGMKQRVMIALALSSGPEVLIADNPTTALDSTIQLQFLHLLLELRERINMTVLYISHDLGVVARICDRVAIMYAGQIVECGDVWSVLCTPVHPYTVGLLDCAPRLGGRGRLLVPIPGKPPDPIDPPPGCRFATRCARAQEACRDPSGIPLRQVGDGHFVRCIV